MQGVCPDCGAPSYCSPGEPSYPPPQALEMICERFHISHDSSPSREVAGPDRFIVSKFLRPRRWDVIAFRHPEHPSTGYVMRLVGLPGERISIEDGFVWADGKKLEPPESLGEIHYETEFGSRYPFTVWGAPDRPAVLKIGEYFVLGDFTTKANDSRLWEEGALGHAPFAVPEGHIEGVVTHIYWPPWRARVLR